MWLGGAKGCNLLQSLSGGTSSGQVQRYYKTELGVRDRARGSRSLSLSLRDHRRGRCGLGAGLLLHGEFAATAEFCSSLLLLNVGVIKMYYNIGFSQVSK